MSTNKKVKRLCNFNDNWLTNEKYKEFLEKIDENTAHCKLCNVSFTVKYDGVYSINSHSKSDKHKNTLIGKRLTNPINNFFVTKETSEEKRVIASEVAMIYHNVQHNLSYNSLDCNLKMISKIFDDSKIAKKISCGRTKSELVVTNVLFPHSIETNLSKLANKKFSIAIDASNKGNIKYFPICIRFFDKKDGIQNFVLDFYSDSKEDSLSVFKKMKEIVEENNLKLENIVLFSADNAPVNFGINYSVFQKLKQINNNVIKANCNCHILHNAAKTGLKKLDFDIESLILKIYSEFSTSAKRLGELKELFENENMKFEDILKHIPTAGYHYLLPSICLLKTGLR
jgi:hypothetical protein